MVKIYYINASKPFAYATSVPFVRNRAAEADAIHYLLTHSLQEFVNHKFPVSYLNLCYHNETIACFIKISHGVVCALPSRLLALVNTPGVSIRLSFAEFRAFRDAHSTYSSYVDDLFTLWDVPHAQVLDFSVLSSYFLGKTDTSLSELLDEVKSKCVKAKADADHILPLVGIIAHFYTAKISTWSDILASILVVCSIYRIGDVSSVVQLCYSYLPAGTPVSQSLDDFDGNWSVVYPILAILSSVVMLRKVPNAQFLKQLLNNSSSITRLLSSGPQAWSNLIIIFEYVYDFILLKMFNKKRQHLKDLEFLLEGLTDWEANVNEVLTLDFRADIVKERSTCNLIEKLFFQGNHLSACMNKLRLDATQKAHFTRLYNHISNLYTLVDNIGASSSEPRDIPVALYLYGRSGTGKSTLTPAIAVECLKMVSPALVLNYDNEVYPRNSLEEYWSGYSNHTVCVYDDFAQVKDSATSPNMELLEIIKTGNIAPYPLNKAHLIEKGKSFFNSKFIICTSNQQRPAISSLVSEEAVWRRFSVSAELSFDPRVLTNGRLDYAKQYSLFGTTGFDPNVYRFKIYRMTDYSTLHNNLSFKEYIELIRIAHGKGGKITRDVLTYIDAQKKLISDSINLPPTIPKVINLGVPLCSEPVDLKPKPKAQNLDDPILPIEYFDDDDYAENIAEVDYFSHFTVRSNLSAFYDDYLANPVETTAHLLKTGAIALNEQIHTVATSWSCKLLSNPIIVAGSICIGLLGALVAYKMFSPKQPKVEPEISSGDAKTSQVKQPVVEMSSGDAKTAQIKQPVVEMSSGDMKTRINNHPIVEMSSGDSKTSRVLRPLTEIESEGCLDQNTYEIVNYALPQNSYRIYTQTGEDIKQRLNGVFVHGRTLLTVAHFLPYLENCDFIILKGLTRTYKIPKKEIQISHVKTSAGIEKDAILLGLPAYITPHRSLLKYFLTRTDLKRLTTVPICIVALREFQDKFVLNTTTTTADAVENVTYVDGITDRLMRNGYYYRARTVKGDCGSIVIAEAPALIRKILGIHVAGTPGYGYGLSLTFEDLDDALSRLSLNCTLADSELPVSQVADYTPDGAFIPIGDHDKHYMQPMKTTIRPSLIHGEIAPVISAPSRLRPTSLIDPLEEALKKAGKQPPLIPQKYLDRAYKSIKSKVFFPKRSHCRKLTRTEAVEGIEGENFICSMNRLASAGFGWSKEAPPNYPGKTYWLGADDDFHIDEDVHAALDIAEECLKNNQRMSAVWVDTLKDERRSLAKVAAGKTRVFAAGQMDYIILFRQYFLGFIADTMEHRIDNEIAVGINAEGPEWQKLALKLLCYSDNVIAGDFSNYDGSLSAQVLKLVLNLVNEWYDDEYSNERSLLFEEICHSIHINGNHLYQWTHSQPSGNPFTAVLNSLANMVYNRICFYKLTENTPYAGQNFETYVTMIAYGDDNVLGVHPLLHDYFNCATLTRTMADFGMTYTDEKKTGTVNNFRKLSEVSFLKRAFVLRNAIWRAPLELEGILESLNWIRGPLNDKLSLFQNLQTQLENLTCHGPVIFKHWADIIEKAISTKELNFTMNTYEGYDEILLTRFFT